MTIHVVPWPHLHERGDTHPKEPFHRAYVWTCETICRLHGHDFLLHYDRDRLSLRCGTCGYTTRGWEVGPIHKRRSARR